MPDELFQLRPQTGRGVGLVSELGPGDLFLRAPGKAASKQGSSPLHSKKASYGNACASPPLPSRSQWSISEDALHQLRWPGGGGAGEEGGWAQPPPSPHPQSGSLVELTPSAFSCHLSPSWPSDALLLAEVCGCQKRKDYGKQYLLWFCLSAQKNVSGLNDFLQKKKMRSQQTREAVTGVGGLASFLLAALRPFPQPLGPQSPLKTLSSPSPAPKEGYVLESLGQEVLTQLPRSPTQGQALTGRGGLVYKP